MTKHVRVENADLSNHPMRVTVQDKIFREGEPNGVWIDTEFHQLDLPTAMKTLYITSTRRLVIEEIGTEVGSAP